jgi:hypothetical protein
LLANLHATPVIFLIEWQGINEAFSCMVELLLPYRPLCFTLVRNVLLRTLSCIRCSVTAPPNVFCVQNPFPLPRFAPTARALMLRMSPVQRRLLIYLNGLTRVFIRNTMPKDQCSRKDLRPMLLLRLFSEGTAMRIFQESTLPPQACNSHAVAAFGRRGSAELLPTCCSLL